MLRHGPLRAPRSENALLMQWTHIATCAIFVKLRTQESAKRAIVIVARKQQAPAMPGLGSVDKVNTTGHQEQAAAWPRRQAIDFRAFPPGGIADDGGANPATRALSSE